MQIVYHLGAHCTDEERLLRCLLKNRAGLAEQGIVVPGPARYRTLLRDTAVALKGDNATAETRALVLEQIVEDSRASRVILSWDSFLAYPQWALRGRLYPSAPERIRAFTRIFPGIPAEFHLAIRNPATLLPALLEKQKNRTHAEFLEGTDPFDLRWSDLIGAILARNPGIPLTIWCDEDTPLIWPDVLRAVSGHAPGIVLEDADALLRRIMTPEGLDRHAAYLTANPPNSDQMRRKITSAFLDRYALPDEIEVEVEMPGWTEDTIARLTDAYDADVARIAQMEGITFLAP